jgi:hypothetical protein
MTIENTAKPDQKLQGRGTILEGQRGLNEEDAGRMWMDGNRQGVGEEKKRTFPDEVKNLHASRRSSLIDLTMERGNLHRARRGLSSHTVTN